MPRVNFAQTGNRRPITPLPEGDYRCRVMDVEESTTRNGDEMWRLTLEVAGGTHAGRRVFDNLVFSDRALPRLKLFCSALGLPASGEVNLTPSMILDRECVVTVAVEEYVDAAGITRPRNRVAFEGYRSVAAQTEPRTADQSDEDLPF